MRRVPADLPDKELDANYRYASESVALPWRYRSAQFAAASDGNWCIWYPGGIEVHSSQRASGGGSTNVEEILRLGSFGGSPLRV
jgi:hypothetical protein